MTDADNRINNLPAGTCQSLAKPYLTARQAAEILGVPESIVVSDIERGFDHLDGLIGGRFGDAWILYSWQLAGEHLERHRARLAGRESVTP